MQFRAWEPAYKTILAAFGYDRADDERARDTLAGLLLADAVIDPAAVSLSGRVAIAGAGPTLEAEADRASTADTVVAASSAAGRLEEQGIAVDWLVTDLDGRPATAVRLTTADTPVAVHAHGDNVAAVREWVPAMDPASVLPTTQAAPAAAVSNVGGFTDGDRAAFLADALGATELTFLGWQFDDPTVSPEKRRKLAWAERLLHWLERRRGERFGVLDGRRESLTLSWLTETETETEAGTDTETDANTSRETDADAQSDPE